MSNLYIDRRGIEIRCDGEALAFYDASGRIGTVPMAPLSRVFLRGDVKFSASLLGKLGEHNIGVIILSGRKGEASLLMGRPHNDAHLRLAQYRSVHDTNARFELARWLVTEKLQAQQALLQHYLEQRHVHRFEISLQLHRFKELLDDKLKLAKTTQSLRGLEGAGARSFFQAFGKLLPDSLGFNGRNRRPPKDPANAILSLGYTLLHNEAVITLYGAGFDPYIGFYHELNYGRESLACDIIEPMRPLIAQFTIELFAKQTLTREHFSMVKGGCFLGKAGRQHFYQAYNELHETMLQQLSDNIRLLKMHLYELTNDCAFGTTGLEESTNERLSDLL